jgi:predicted NAD/FAD-dependent oxidoreductase
MKRIGIIGAGIAGAACAGMLAAQGGDVTVFDKARGVGGRLATRRLDSGWATLGCPFLHAQREPFRRQLQAWVAAGAIASVDGVIARGNAAQGWQRVQRSGYFQPLIEPSALVRTLLGAARVRVSAQVAAVNGDTVALADGESIGGFDRIVVATPAPQAAALLAAHPELQRELATVEYEPRWSFLMRWDGGLRADAIDFDDSLLQLAVRQRFAAPGLWAVHATRLFSETYRDASLEEVTTRAASALVGLVGLAQPIDVLAAHRWLYALPVRTLDKPCLQHASSGIAVIGDGIAGDTLENAWESGVACARALLGDAA